LTKILYAKINQYTKDSILLIKQKTSRAIYISQCMHDAVIELEYNSF